MIFRQIIHEDLSCASYFVAEEQSRSAAVVDPRFDIEIYLQLEHELDLKIEHILETHTHADHVSGHGRLAHATGATIHINHLAEAQYKHQPIDDGNELSLGDLL